jgi:ABC-type sugar transport system permease subunit
MFQKATGMITGKGQSHRLRGLRILVVLSVLLLEVLSPVWAAKEEVVTFRAQGLPLPAQTDVSAIAARAVLRTFLEQHPNYEIEAFTMPQIGGTSAMDAGPLMAISAGIPPHAIYVNFRQSSTYISQGFLEPIEILLARILSENEALRQTNERGEWMEDPAPAEIEEAKRQIRARVPALTWPVIYRPDESGRSDETHVWAMPYNNLVSAMFYRKDLFFEAGLDPERPPQTWDELIDYSRLLRVPERQQYGMLFAAGLGLGYSSYNFLISNDARAIVQDEDGEWRAAFHSREAAEAIHFVWRLINEPFERDGRIIRGSSGLTTGNRALEWERGKVAIQFGYLSEEMVATINPQLVGIAPVPISPRGTRAGELNAMMLGVFSDSTPQQQLAVMRYIWFTTGEEAQRIRTRVFVESGFGQFVNPDLLEKFGYHRLLRRVPPGWQEAFQTAINSGVPEPYGRNTQFIYRWMSEPIERVLEMDLTGLTEEAAVGVVQRELTATADELNLRVLGALPPEEMRQRRIVAGVILTLMAVAFAFGLSHIWRYFTREAPSTDIRGNWRRYAWGFALVVPGMALVTMWQYLPLLAGGMSIAFMDYRIVLDSVWVGVDNFANILYDDRFWSALGRSLYFVALAIGIGFWPPILLAILLHEVPTNTAKYIYRTIFYLPSVLIGIVVMFLWRELYNPSADGVLNKIILTVNILGPFSATIVKWMFLGMWGLFIGLLIWLPIRLEEMARPMKIALWLAGAVFLGVTLSPLVGAYNQAGMSGALGVLGNLYGRFELQPFRWLQSPEMAMLCIVIPMVWASSGPGCIIYLAALKGIPEELYEAADIDGASNWHKIFYIVLPRLKYLIVIQFVAAVIAAFRGGEEFILVMTGGGPGNATTILSLEIFFRTFMDLEFGVGTAMAWMMGALLIGFTAYQLKILSRAEFKAAG